MLVPRSQDIQLVAANGPEKSLRASPPWYTTMDHWVGEVEAGAAEGWAGDGDEDEEEEELDEEEEEEREEQERERERPRLLLLLLRLLRCSRPRPRSSSLLSLSSFCSRRRRLW